MCFGSPKRPAPPEIPPPIIPAPPRVATATRMSNPRASGVKGKGVAQSRRRLGKKSLVIPRSSGLNYSS